MHASFFVVSLCECACCMISFTNDPILVDCQHENLAHAPSSIFWDQCHCHNWPWTLTNLLLWVSYVLLLTQPCSYYMWFPACHHLSSYQLVQRSLLPSHRIGLSSEVIEAGNLGDYVNKVFQDRSLYERVKS